MENPEIFNKWKSQVEDCNLNSFSDCFRQVEVNLSSVCNLRCPFCPQSHGFHRESKFMSVDTAKEIAKQLRECNFTGFMCIGGHGEPSLNPNFEEIVNIFKDFNPQLVTNGTQLDKETWERLDKIGQIKLSIHNWSNLDYYKDKFGNTKAWFRNHDMKNPQINLFNRGGYLGKPSVRITRICHLPWYWIFIDTDGKYLQCAHDWEHTSETELSIYNTKIKDFFMNVLEPVREKMDSENGRQNFECCKDCDIDGTMVGSNFVECWRKEHGKERRI